MYITEDYDNTLRKILEKGIKSKNRTGVDTLSIFGTECRYNVSEYFPLLTKRKIFYKGVFGELLWMISGSTHVKDANKLGCNFWNDWAAPKNKDSLDFYNRTGFPVGYLGKVYGWQMRHFGGDYNQYLNTPNVYERDTWDSGFDQLSWLIEEIEKNPTSRRLIVSYWNPNDLQSQRLPCCHYSWQIIIDVETKNMSLLLNMRSVDWPIGSPSNVAFYTALLYMIAKATGYKPYEVIQHCGDTHIYENQIPMVKEYLETKEVDSPKLELTNEFTNIFSYKPEHFNIIDYNPVKTIKIPVLV